MAWSYEVKDINKPSLVQIRVQFTLKNDGADYVTDEVTIGASELEGMTNAQKLTLIKARVADKVAPYILTYKVADGLQQYVGATVNI